MIPQLKDILKLSVSERILLAEAIWDSITEEEHSTYQVSHEQQMFLDKEMEEYKKNPSAGFTWEELKNKVRKKKK